MDIKIIFVLLLTFIINVIGTLAYSTRITALRTGKIAISFSIFNILILVSRTANTLQGPLLSKKVETGIGTAHCSSLPILFHYILASAAVGCVFGACAMPTFQNLLFHGVFALERYRSFPRLLVHSLPLLNPSTIKKHTKLPTGKNIHIFLHMKGVPKKLFLFNIVVTALSASAVLSSLYASILMPDSRITCMSLTAVITFAATILSYLFIDPTLSLMSEDVITGRRSSSSFSKCIAFMAYSRIIGSIIAQFVLLPGALVIAKIATL